MVLGATTASTHIAQVSCCVWDQNLQNSVFLFFHVFGVLGNVSLTNLTACSLREQLEFETVSVTNAFEAAEGHWPMFFRRLCAV